MPSASSRALLSTLIAAKSLTMHVHSKAAVAASSDHAPAPEGGKDVQTETSRSTMTFVVDPVAKEAPTTNIQQSAGADAG